MPPFEAVSRHGGILWQPRCCFRFEERRRFGRLEGVGSPLGDDVPFAPFSSLLADLPGRHAIVRKRLKEQVFQFRKDSGGVQSPAGSGFHSISAIGDPGVVLKRRQTTHDYAATIRQVPNRQRRQHSVSNRARPSRPAGLVRFRPSSSFRPHLNSASNASSLCGLFRRGARG